MSETGHGFGGWQVRRDPPSFYYPPADYSVPVEEAMSAEGAFDHIMRVAGQEWATGNDIAGFVMTLKAVFYPHETFGGTGERPDSLDEIYRRLPKTVKPRREIEARLHLVRFSEASIAKIHDMISGMVDRGEMRLTTTPSEPQATVADLILVHEPNCLAPGGPCLCADVEIEMVFVGFADDLPEA
ncbi:hypothetical protein N9980_01565 [bacterium]|nr:hypothetical protein [bacterium]